jgi:hypothetical protein
VTPRRTPVRAAAGLRGAAHGLGLPDGRVTGTARRVAQPAHGPWIRFLHAAAAMAGLKRGGGARIWRQAAGRVRTYARF